MHNEWRYSFKIRKLNCILMTYHQLAWARLPFLYFVSFHCSFPLIVVWTMKCRFKCRFKNIAFLFAIYMISNNLSASQTLVTHIYSCTASLYHLKLRRALWSVACCWYHIRTPTHIPTVINTVSISLKSFWHVCSAQVSCIFFIRMLA